MTNARPFRFGVVAESAPSKEVWVELVRRAQDLGYATFLLADHYVNEFPPLAALMTAADATSTIRIATRRSSPRRSRRSIYCPMGASSLASARDGTGPNTSRLASRLKAPESVSVV